MKQALIISLVFLLAACDSSDPEPEVPQQVCDGKFEKINGRHYRMTCDDGRVMNYTSYKYDITVK